MGSKKGGGQKYQVTDYFMSIHYGICWGPIDALLGVYIKERDAWPGKTIYEDDDDSNEGDFTVSFADFITSLNGNLPTATNTVAIAAGPLSINRPDLFGGDKKEGGAVGTAYFLPGTAAQVLPENLAAKLGLTSATAPGFRNLASVWFYAGSQGFMWCQNNPYLPSAWFTVYRRPVGLSATKSTIQVGNLPPDANPAHIIYECLTNPDWGMGSPTTLINVASFEECGDALSAEDFGMSMGWTAQAQIEDFVKEVLDHIQATLFVDPGTGLLTLKLIRDDFVPAVVPLFTPDNCEATNRQRKAWAETINEIVVTWTNPVNEQEETITFQDLANIAMQGGVVTDSRNYYGVRNSDLASRLGVRDIRASSYPLFSCDLEIDRTAWNLLPGSVCRLNWPEDGIENMLLRVGKVDYGRPGDMTVKASVIEDVFSLEQSEYTAPPTTGWTDPSENPAPFAFTQFMTTPLPALIAAGLASDDADSQFPRVAPAILARQPGTDTAHFVLNGPRSLPSGGTEFAALGTFRQTARSASTIVFADEAVSTWSQAQMGAMIGYGSASLGGLLLIGSGSDKDMELALLESVDAITGVWTVARGIWDTVPKQWPAGTPVWYLGRDFEAVDTVERLADNPVGYKLQPRTSRGLLPLAEAPLQTFTPDLRPYRPFRPANVQIDGSGFGVKTYTGTARPATIPVSWATRNRFAEDQLIQRFTAGNVTPEDNTTYIVRAYPHGGATVLYEEEGVTGTTATVPFDQLQGYRDVDIAVFASRDDIESLQAARRRVTFDLYGYGNNYGNDYGQNDN